MSDAQNMHWRCPVGMPIRRALPPLLLLSAGEADEVLGVSGLIFLFFRAVLLLLSWLVPIRWRDDETDDDSLPSFLPFLLPLFPCIGLPEKRKRLVKFT